jgi:beta-glucanase (GH16 family)
LRDHRPAALIRPILALLAILGAGLSGVPAAAATTTTATSVTTTSASTTTASTATAIGTTAPATVLENWAGPAPAFHPATASTRMTIVPAPGALDGHALRLQLNARPEPGASGGAVISSNRLYRYGTFGTRMKTADCTGQDHPGVVTGAFTYAADHSDANHNGITDNDEIDVEFLCAQPDVVYLTVWTDYSETSNDLRAITRTINLRTGTVLSTCSIVSYGTGCRPLLAGENRASGVVPSPGFNSATQFHTYLFDWQPDRVTFYLADDAGRRTELWDYRGPRSRIPDQPGWFLQNVTHTRTWDPLNGPAHNQPTASTAALIDSTTVPAAPSTARQR